MEVRKAISTLIKAIIALGVLVSTVASAQTRSSLQRDDKQLWNEVQLTAPLYEKIDLVLGGSLRLGRDVSHLVQERISVGFAFNPSKHFTLTPSYLYQSTQPLPDQKTFENRLALNGAFRFALGKFALSDGNQIERRFISSRPAFTRYRNRLRIEHPVSLGDIKFDAFVADEVFYDWSVKAWARNRFSVGIKKQINRHCTGEVFYLRQNDAHSHPGDLNVAGITLRIRL
jgi:Protein of unknown function (DUF2490)